MPALGVRPCHRADHGQLTELINRHVAAVVPGVRHELTRTDRGWEHRPWPGGTRPGPAA